MKPVHSIATSLKMFTLAALACGSASAASVVSYHDIGGAASGGNITNQYADAANGFNTVTTSTVALKNYSTGAATGVSVKVDSAGTITHDHRTTGVSAAPTTGTDAAALFNGFGLNFDGLINVANATMTITFTGLISGTLYDLAFYGDRASSAYDGKENFTLGGALAGAINDSSVKTPVSNTSAEVSGLTATFDTRSNSGATKGYVARWTDIDPGSDGTITMTMVASGSGSLSAMRLEAIPEPRAALLGGLGLLALLRRRR